MTEIELLKQENARLRAKHEDLAIQHELLLIVVSEFLQASGVAMLEQALGFKPEAAS
jgi:hypothetical protein